MSASCADACSGVLARSSMPLPERRGPTGSVTVTAPLHQGATVQYHVASETPPQPEAQPIAPSLEDSYVWRMRFHDQRSPVLA